MGETGLAVLITVLVVGLVVSVLLSWVTRLASTGHAPRAAAREAGPPTPVRRRTEPRTGRSALGGILAVLVTTLLLALLVPDLVSDVDVLEEVPMTGLVLSFAALMVAVVYALPSWLEVRR